MRIISSLARDIFIKYNRTTSLSTTLSSSLSSNLLSRYFSIENNNNNSNPLDSPVKPKIKIKKLKDDEISSSSTSSSDSSTVSSNSNLNSSNELKSALDAAASVVTETVSFQNSRVSMPTQVKDATSALSSSALSSGTISIPTSINEEIKDDFLDLKPYTYHLYNTEEDLREKERIKRMKAAIEAYEASTRITFIGMAANLGLGISKGITGFYLNSQALISDAVNSLGDVIGDIIVLYTITEARKSSTPELPWGRGKFEPLGALGVGTMLLGAGFYLGYAGFIDAMSVLDIKLDNIDPRVYLGLIEPSSIVGPPVVKEELLHQHIPYGIMLSGLGIVIKEALFRYTLKIGEKANSTAVIANAYQHKSDAIASWAVLFGLSGTYFLNLPIMDPIAGIAVSGLIIKQAVSILQDSIEELTDKPAEEKDVKELINTCLKVPGVLGIKKMLARKSGPYLFVEALIEVDGSISASAAHRIAELTRLELMKEYADRVSNAVVHIMPQGSSGLGEQYPFWARDHDFIKGEIKRAVLPIKEIHSVSEVQVYYRDNGLISTKVDIILPSNLTIQEAHAIAVRARRAIEVVLPGIGDVDVDLELEEA